MPALVVLGLLAVVGAASAGPVDVIGPSTVGRHLTHRAPSASPSVTPSTSADPLHGLRQPRTHTLAWVGDLLAWAVLLVVLALLAGALVWLWQNRWHRPPEPPRLDVDPLPEPADVADELGADAVHQLDLLAQGTPRNGIVLCWQRLEEAIAAAGMPRDRAETSTEYAVRVLHALDLDPRAVGTLAALYREARFSEHDLDEAARDTARATLQRLHDDLAVLGRSGTGAVPR